MEITILVATKNKGKLREIINVIDVPGVRFISPDDLPSALPDVEETGETFEENAEIKALHAARVSGLHALADDSGLVVDCLEGAPGVYSSRFAGPDATDAENNAKLVSELGRREPPYTARYVAVMSLAAPNEEIAMSRGTCEGQLISEPRGGGGFGYDPYFVPVGEDRTMAELSPEEKHLISHRGAALRAIRGMVEHLVSDLNLA